MFGDDAMQAVMREFVGSDRGMQKQPQPMKKGAKG